MTEKTKNRLGTIAAIAVIVISIVILIAFYYGAASILWVLSIMNLVSGPICLVLYLREAKKGIFSEKKNLEETVSENK